MVAEIESLRFIVRRILLTNAFPDFLFDARSGSYRYPLSPNVSGFFYLAVACFPSVEICDLMFASGVGEVLVTVYTVIVCSHTIVRASCRNFGDEFKMLAEAFFGAVVFRPENSAGKVQRKRK